MDVKASLLGVFVLLMLCVYKGIDIFYPLFVGLAVFVVIGHKRGHRLKDMAAMILKGVRKSMIITGILLLIGAITAVWRASGTVAFMVYHGLKLINPNLFVLYAFLLSSLVSFLLGTSFGTVGTIGVILMVMVKGGSINTNIVAGAIIAGAYFGDRCSPMSSSANLVATITETDLYINIKNMLKTTAIPFVSCIIIYGAVSFQNPLQLGDAGITREMAKAFKLHWITVLPALIVLALAAFKVEVKLSMLASIACGSAVAMVVQKESFSDILKYIAMGYRRPEQGFLGDIIAGGGIASMLNILLVILLSFALMEIFEGTSMLKDMEELVYRIGGKAGIFMTTILTSIIAASFGCSQTLAIMLTYQLVKNMYALAGIDKYELAVDIENTAIVISVLIPWNIAGAVPAAALAADGSYAVYSFYLYLLPFINLITKKLGFIKLQKAD